MTKSENDLVTMDEAVEALGGRVKAAAIRAQIRKGKLPCHHKQKQEGRLFAKRSELLELYSRFYRLAEGKQIERRVGERRPIEEKRGHAEGCNTRSAT